MENNTMTITMDDYKTLQRNSIFLNALRNAGVDNWDGYSYALEIFRQSYPEDDE